MDHESTNDAAPEHAPTWNAPRLERLTALGMAEAGSDNYTTEVLGEGATTYIYGPS